jgi:MoaA/NifB/PqqE/SkfB family radical SAM enzyme
MIINNTELEVLRECTYIKRNIGLISNYAYMSIVVTNACNKNCFYCINSETDSSLQLDINKALKNIKRAVKKYNIKEAVLLGGEPTLHSQLFEFIEGLKHTGLQRFGITTNGIRLLDEKFCKKLAKSGVSWINISTDIEPYSIYHYIKEENPEVKVRLNINIYKKHFDTLTSIISLISKRQKECCDEMRISNLIFKDNFSINNKNNEDSLQNILSEKEYEELFKDIVEYYTNYVGITVIENPKALGFVKYYLIPLKHPVILNCNINSKVSEQVCENDITTRKIHTFKCLVSGDISLSWNQNNIIKI